MGPEHPVDFGTHSRSWNQSPADSERRPYKSASFSMHHDSFMVNGVGFLISQEDDLALGPGTRLDHSRVFV